MATREVRAIDKKAQILRAARSVVSDGGFAELQMNAVASAAGIAVGTIYRYFPSRAELCAAIVSTVSQREVDVLSGIAVADGKPGQKVRDAARAFVLRAMRGRRLAYGLIFEPIDPEVESTRLKYRRAIAKVFATILNEGVITGEFRELDVEVSATCLVGAFMEGLVSVLAPGAPGVPSRPEAFADSIAELCLAAVAKPSIRSVHRNVKPTETSEPIPLQHKT